MSHQSNNSNDHTYSSYKKITDFVEQLNEAYGKNFHELALYHRIIEKTKFTNKIAVKQHIKLFTEFCIRNQTEIIAKNKSLIFKRISWSEKVFIDLYSIINQEDIDNETLEVIWNHLLVISSALNPTTQINNLLKQLQTSLSSKKEDSQHNEQNNNEQNNGQQNILGDILGSLGSLNLGGNGGENGGNPLGNMLNLLQGGGLASTLANANGQADGNPLGALAGIGSLLSGLNGSTPGQINLKSIIGSMKSVLTNLEEQLDNGTTEGNGENNASPNIDMSELSNLVNLVTNKDVLTPTNNEDINHIKDKLDEEKVRQEIENSVNLELEKIKNDNNHNDHNSNIDHVD